MDLLVARVLDLQKATGWNDITVDDVTDVLLSLYAGGVIALTAADNQGILEWDVRINED